MSVQPSNRSDLGLDRSLIGLYGPAQTDRMGPLSIPILGSAWQLQSFGALHQQFPCIVTFYDYGPVHSRGAMVPVQ